MAEWKLEEGEEILIYGIKGFTDISKLVYVQFGGSTHQSALKSLNLIESYVMELEEHQRWKDMIWLEGSSPSLPSNFAMS